MDLGLVFVEGLALQLQSLVGEGRPQKEAIDVMDMATCMIIKS